MTTVKHGPRTSFRRKASSCVGNALETLAPRKKADHLGSSDSRALSIRDCTLWTGDGFREGSILVENGKISKIGISVPQTSRSISGRGLLALPGLIDVHVHLRDMELAYKEDFLTGTSAAAAGGFTSLLDMPNSKPVVDSPERLKERMNVASRRVVVNVGFHVAAVGGIDRLKVMAELGAFSLKLYMPRPISPLNVDDDEELLPLMRGAARNHIPITVHAEEPSLIRDSSQTKTWIGLAGTRPNTAESRAVKRMLKLQSMSQCSIHFTHMTLPSSLETIWSRHSTLATSEVTPHHLMLSELELGKFGGKAWMVPPLRTQSIARRLLSATSQGKATLIASDHAPHSLAEKTARLHKVLPGVPGLETTLPLLLTLVHRGRLSMKRMIDMLTIAPARRFRIAAKGRLAKGTDGDLVLVDPKAVSRINPGTFLSKAKYSPFAGFEARGKVEVTIVGGQVVFDHGRIVGNAGTGRILKRAD